MSLESASAAFETSFGRAPTIAARAPGRVNLIGEHIDYHGLPVLPFAIDRAVTVLAAPAIAGNASRARFVTMAAGLPAVWGVADEFDLRRPLVAIGGGDWRDYARAAARWLVDTTGAERGMDALVTSDLPMASGLSSSSALVVACALAFARVNDLAVGRVRLAHELALAEQFAGTRGGGMDQAASLLSRAGHVSFVSFEPLRVEYVPFPDEAVVIVVDSGERAAKSGTARRAYNERRAAGVEALRRVAASLDAVGSSYATLLRERAAADLVEAAEEVLDGALLGPFRHTVREACRVDAAAAALRRGDIPALGRLLVASHRSLRDDLAVSTERLDAIVEVALHAGALGARLTGAGFGGSAIALADAGRAAPVREALEAWLASPAAAAGKKGTQERLLEVRPADPATTRTFD
jgi:galactokinase